MNGKKSELSAADPDRVFQMGREARTPFDAIAAQLALNESTVIQLVRAEFERNSFERWAQLGSKCNDQRASIRARAVAGRLSRPRRNATHARADGNCYADEKVLRSTHQ